MINLQMKMIPRFYYTFPFLFYIKAFLFKNKSTGHLLDGKNFYYTNRARTGLRILLSSISNKKLRVGVQVFTCHTVFQAIKNAGHEIVFLDITNGLKLDLDFLRDKKDDIDVLIVTHTFGYADKFEEIKSILGEEKIIIEDCAHAYLSMYKGNLCGTLGDASILSFGLGKFPPIGVGGGVILNTPEKFPLFIDMFNSLKKENFIKGLMDWSKLLVYSLIMKRPIYGLFTRRLGKILDKKVDFVNKYSFKESRGSFMGLRLLFYSNLYSANLLEINKKNLKLFYANYRLSSFEDSDGENAYIFSLLVEDRDKIYNHLLSKGVEVGKHFERSLVWARNFGYENSCPCAEAITRKILTIPLHKSVHKTEVIMIANLLTEISKRK